MAGGDGNSGGGEGFPLPDFISTRDSGAKKSSSGTEDLKRK